MSGPTAPREPLPKLSLRLVLKILGAFVLALGLWYLLRYPYGRIVALLSDLPLRALEGAEDSVLRVKGARVELVTKLVRRGGGPAMVLELRLQDLYDAYWNMILFVSVALLTPLRMLKERWRGLLAASGALFACHVVFLTAAMFIVLEGAYAGAGLARHSGALMTVVAGSSHLYKTILAPLLPFLLLAPLWLVRRRAQPRTGSSPERARRNDPCPCGSGRKFKRCCGR